jgi:diguanylate cyclase (GGDEF)-like protein
MAADGENGNGRDVTAVSAGGAESSRDADAALRDRRALERDRAADRRDLAGTEREQVEDRADDLNAQNGSTRSAYRTATRSDRASAAEDRVAAAEDRAAAASDRAAAAGQIRALMRDELTGFYQRGVGLAELEREVARSRRTGEPFTIAFVDVDGLKAVNDAEGHDAGDRLIARVADAMRSALRAYDVVIRYGGDEFVCGLLGIAEGPARDRFARMRDDLASVGAGASFGVAERRPDESLAEVISRADTAMYDAKGHRRRDL